MSDNHNQLLEERGVKPTSIRILILKSMLEFDGAFSLTDLETKLESVDKSTISRTIHLFRNNLLIHSFDDGSGSTKYSMCSYSCNCTIDELHAHFYCNYCKKAFCLQNITIPHFQLPEGIELESANLVLKGFCGSCKKKCNLVAQIYCYLCNKGNNMKPLVIVISFYLLLLSVAPCHCEESIINDTVSKTELILLDSDQLDNDIDTDFLCTSFCKCADTHNPNFFVKQDSQPTPTMSFVANVSVYIDTYNSTLYYSLWQPPQVV